jgi:hypothetical protein
MLESNSTSHVFRFVSMRPPSTVDARNLIPLSNHTVFVRTMIDQRSDTEAHARLLGLDPATASPSAGFGVSARPQLNHVGCRVGWRVWWRFQLLGNSGAGRIRRHERRSV